ncbi:MAG: DUF3617 domain-containing protein [Sphingorhabdus sp.]
MRKILILGAASLALAACSSGGDADKDGDGKISAEEASAEMASGGKMELQPGEYEMKVSFTEVDAPGIPEVARDMVMKQMAKGMTVKNCITKEQAENPGADMFGGQGDNSCKMDKLDRSGNSMNVAMTCNPEGGMKIVSSMQGTFGKDSYTMTIDQKMTGMPTGDMAMKGKIEAKRIGDCPG